MLRFTPDCPFARFQQTRIQDGTSFAVRSTLAETFPGRFTTVSPATVELHVSLELTSEIVNQVALSADSAAERQYLPAPEELVGELLLADRGYYSKGNLRAFNAAGGSFIVRGKSNMNPVTRKANRPDGRELQASRNKSLKTVKDRLHKYQYLDLDVCFGDEDDEDDIFNCRLVVHPHLREDGAVRYLVINLAPESFSPDHISDGYRSRWQINLLFKEWKSHANLHAFDTGNFNIAEGLIWAALCAATVRRYCAHAAQRITRVAMSTRVVAKCIHHVLDDILYDLMHEPAPAFRASNVPSATSL